MKCFAFLTYLAASLAVVLALSTLGCSDFPEHSIKPVPVPFGAGVEHPGSLFQGYDKTLTEDQQRVYNKAIESRVVVSVEIVTVNFAAASRGSAIMCLPPGMCISIEGITVEDMPAGPARTKGMPGPASKSIRWKRGTDSFNISVLENQFYGLIYCNSKVYSLRPLGGGVHMVYEVNQRKMRDD